MVLFVEHVIELIIEPQSPLFDVGLVFLILQLVGNDDSKLVVGSFGTCIRGNRLSCYSVKFCTLLGVIEGFDELTVEIVDELGLRAAVVWCLVGVSRFFNSNVSN